MGYRRKTKGNSCTCMRCGYKWTSRVPKPKVCAGCNQLNWDRPARAGNYPKGPDHPAAKKRTS